MNAQPRLLVVDDEEPLCQSAIRIFQPRGYDVDTSTSPVEGLRRATSGQYAAVLLDMRMPEMDGLTFLRRLRESGAQVPVIVVTGYASVDDAASFMRMGAVDYLPKPFTPAEVTDAVSRVVQETRELEPTPTPLAGSRLWLGRSWVQLADDGSAVVGSLFEDADSIAKIELPLPGDEIRRGLPCGLVTLTDGTVRAVRSPVSGVVAQAWEGEGRPERGRWILRVRAWDLAADLEALQDTSVDEEEQQPDCAATGPRVSEVVHRVVVRNRRGQSVALVSTGDLLRTHEGLGAAILAEFRRRHLPVSVNLGDWQRDTLEILEDAARFDRTLLLDPDHSGRFAGLLLRTRAYTELLRATRADVHSLRSYAVQSMGGGACLCLDGRTNLVLARILVDELA